MKQRIFITLFCLLLTATMAFGQGEVVVTVDDDAGNDAAYVDGTGGNLTGATAVQQAVDAINADTSTGITTWTIEIVDTDGAQDTYTGDLALQKANTVLKQVANGGGTDTSVIIFGDATLLDKHGSLRVQAQNCTVEGLSPSIPLLLNSADGAADQAQFAVDARSADGAVFRNISVVRGSGANFDFQAGKAGSGTVTFDHCVFTRNNGIRLSDDNTSTMDFVFNDCTIDSGFWKFWMNTAASVTANDCSFGPELFGSGGLATWNAASTLTLNRPVFTGAQGTLPLQPLNFGGVVIVRGTPSSKVDMTGFAGGGDPRLGRITQGTVILEDVAFNSPFDCLGMTGAQEVTFELYGCHLTGNAAVGWTNAATGPRNMIARNCVIDKTGVTGAEAFGIYSRVIAFNYNSAAASTIDIEHCTFYGGETGVANTAYINGAASAAVANISYNIFDADDMDYAGIFVNYGTSAGYNVLDGNWFNNTAVAPPVNSILADPNLDASGVPQSGSPAIDRALNSVIADDYADTARPDGNRADVGAIETALSATEAIAVIVNDTAADDVAYVNGQGGNFSGSAGLFNAVAAVNADPFASVLPPTIQIIDTDGAQDTYTGDLALRQPNLTLKQVANGNGTDTSVIIYGDATLLDKHGNIRVQGQDVTVEGLSPSVPLLLDSADGAADQAQFSVDARSADGALFRNISVVKGSGANYDFQAGKAGSGTVTFENCTFTRNNGIRTSDDNTSTMDFVFNNCTMNSGFWNFWFLTPATITANSCTFGPELFGSGGCATWFAAGTLVMNDPIFTSNRGSLPFSMLNHGGALEVNASSAGKVDLTDLSSSGDKRLGRITDGTVKFSDVLFNEPFDCLGMSDVQEVTFELDGCKLTGNAALGWTNAATGPRNMIARNCVIDKTGVTGAEAFGTYSRVVAFNYNSADAASNIHIEHCTFFGGDNSGIANTAYINGAASAAAANISYNVFDADEMDYAAVFVSFGSSEGYNVLDGNWYNNVSFTPPPFSILGDPNLDASGVPQADAPGTDRAFGSLLADDYSDTARPDGNRPDIGAFESAFTATDAIGAVVNDISTDDAPYVNGVGGNFTSSTAVRSMMTAVNADPFASLFPTEVQLIDTDGTPDTYVGDVFISVPNVTLHQVANGSDTDSTITLVGDAKLTGNGPAIPWGTAVMVVAPGVTVSGLSADRKLVIQPEADQPRGVGINADSCTDTQWNWLEIIQNTNGTGNSDTLEYTATPGSLAATTGTQTFTECVFNLNNGPAPAISGTSFVGCDFNASGLPIANSAAELTIVDSTFDPLNYALYLEDGSAATTLTLEGCTFPSGKNILDDQQFSGNGYQDGAYVEVIDPQFVWNTTTNAVPFNVLGEQLNLTIRGNSPADKADLTSTSAGGVLCRFTSGSITLVDCVVGDSIDNFSGLPNLIGDEGVDYSFDRCEVRRAWIGRVPNDSEVRGPIRITATNSIFEDGSVEGDLGSAVLQTLFCDNSEVTLNHCTVYGPGGAEIIMPFSNSTVVTATNSIIDAGNYTWAANAGDFAASDNNLVVPGVLGGLNGAPAAAEFSGDPFLTAAGFLASENSAAVDAATGTSPAWDIQGEVRLAGQADVGADEIEKATAVQTWQLYDM